MAQDARLLPEQLHAGPGQAWHVAAPGLPGHVLLRASARGVQWLRYVVDQGHPAPSDDFSAPAAEALA